MPTVTPKFPHTTTKVVCRIGNFSAFHQKRTENQATRRPQWSVLQSVPSPHPLSQEVEQGETLWAASRWFVIWWSWSLPSLATSESSVLNWLPFDFFCFGAVGYSSRVERSTFPDPIHFTELVYSSRMLVLSFLFVVFRDSGNTFSLSFEVWTNLLAGAFLLFHRRPSRWWQRRSGWRENWNSRVFCG